jgi:hypothetical protein
MSKVAAYREIRTSSNTVVRICLAIGSTKQECIDKIQSNDSELKFYGGRQSEEKLASQVGKRNVIFGIINDLPTGDSFDRETSRVKCETIGEQTL